MVRPIFIKGALCLSFALLSLHFDSWLCGAAAVLIFCGIDDEDYR